MQTGTSSVNELVFKTKFKTCSWFYLF